MKRAIRGAGLALALLLAGTGAYMGAARAGWLRPDEAAMRARYGLPASRYVTVGAQALHVVEEGPDDPSAPVVVLVHGSFGSLRMWDGWAAALKGRYRVIRFDRPGMGLSGPNPQGRYDGDAEAELIAALAGQMHWPPFVLIGTSSAGEGVAHFAATHPQALRGVVLANIAAGPLKPDPHLTPWFKAVLAFDGMLGGHHVPAFWGGILRMNFADPAAVSPDLISQWTNLNNRAQGWPRAKPKGPFFAGTPADLAAIRVPALALWSDGDTEVPLSKDGRQTLSLLGSADKALVVVPHCGHMLAIECSAASLAPVEVFLDKIGR
jgi:pimeloyl-ACP methyl ester carboxylesterase